MVPPPSHRISRVPWYSGYFTRTKAFVYRAFTFCGKAFQLSSTSFRLIIEVLQPRQPKPPVWAIPTSLAATMGIDFSFSSFGYLDVSVPRVAFIRLCVHLMMTGYYSRRVAPFGYLRIKACLRLPEAFRRLPRPSSALGAKSFTLCSY